MKINKLEKYYLIKIYDNLSRLIKIIYKIKIKKDFNLC